MAVGIVEDRCVDPHPRGAEDVPAAAERVGPVDRGALPLDDQQRGVVRDGVADHDRHDRSDHQPGVRRGRPVAVAAHPGGGQTEADQHENDHGQQSEGVPDDRDQGRVLHRGDPERGVGEAVEGSAAEQRGDHRHRTGRRGPVAQVGQRVDQPELAVDPSPTERRWRPWWRRSRTDRRPRSSAGRRRWPRAP